MIKLVLTDIDDTLIPYGAPYASERTRRAIHGFLDEGLHFGPVSGRVPNAMGWMFGGDERCFLTGAFANGQVIRIDGEIVREVPTDSELLREVAGVLDELGYDAWLTVYSLDECGVTFVTSREEQLRDCLLRVGYGRPNRVTREPWKFSYLKSNVYCVCSRADDAHPRHPARAGRRAQLRLPEHGGTLYRHKPGGVGEGRGRAAYGRGAWRWPR